MSASIVSKQELLGAYTAIGDYDHRAHLPPDLVVDAWRSHHKARHPKAGGSDDRCIMSVHIFSDSGGSDDDFSVGVVPGDLSEKQRILALDEFVRRRDAAEKLAGSFTGDLVCVSIRRNPRVIQTGLGNLVLDSVHYGTTLQVSSETYANTGDPLPYLDLACDALAATLKSLPNLPDHS